MVIHPRPPTRISTQMMACPAVLQYTGVSTTVSPVTVAAEAAVKRETIKGVHSPVVLAKGKSNKPVPIAMRSVRPISRVKGEFSR
jgi:hypothetical protein